MSDKTLKPCPFCGSEMRFIPTEQPKGWRVGGVHGQSCPFSILIHDDCTTFITREAAAESWNSRAPIEYDGWFYLPKPKEGIVAHGEPEITRTENGYKVRNIADVVDEAARKWSEELGEYAMHRICEIWNTRAELGSGKPFAMAISELRDTVREAFSGDSVSMLEEGHAIMRAIDAVEAAELGSGTCENTNTDGYGLRFECSECGYSTIVHNCAVRLDELPNYCPNCGKAVDR